MQENSFLWIIIIVTAVISIQGFYNYNFFERYKFRVSSILKNKQYERLLVSGFLHADWMHLFFNMFSLYFLGKGISGIYFLLIYIGSILSGSLWTLYFNKKNFSYTAVGASGGVSGIIYAVIALQPKLSLFIFPIPFPIQGWLFAIFYIYYSAFGMKRNWGDAIGHGAHLGGALFGLLCILFFNPELIQLNGIYILLMLLPVAYLIFSELKNR